LIFNLLRSSRRAIHPSYISLLEIGGSHAHRLRPLLETLGLLSLVITDLDSIGKTGTAKVFPERDKQYRTGNTTLKEWIPKKESLDELLDCKDEGKQSENEQIRVKDQIFNNVHCLVEQ
jgi:predicted ATP-dependent endonuclease of OLD family